jgi:hypothetical protein
VRGLVEECEDLGLLKQSRVGFSNRRLAYDDIVARSCVAIEQGTLSRHINNNVVEEYYRTSEFSHSTVDGFRLAAHELDEQVETAGGRVKFNKGTMQTWFLYCFWAPRATGPLPKNLLAEFERVRAQVRRGERDEAETQQERLQGIVAVYDDRASYRVTDVSSVVARDLAIHLFSVAQYGTEPVKNSDRLVEDILGGSGGDANRQMFEYIADVEWGDPLLRGQ